MLGVQSVYVQSYSLRRTGVLRLSKVLGEMNFDNSFQREGVFLKRYKYFFYSNNPPDFSATSFCNAPSKQEKIQIKNVEKN